MEQQYLVVINSMAKPAESVSAPNPSHWPSISRMSRCCFYAFAHITLHIQNEPRNSLLEDSVHHLYSLTGNSPSACHGNQYLLLLLTTPPQHSLIYLFPLTFSKIPSWKLWGSGTLFYPVVVQPVLQHVYLSAVATHTGIVQRYSWARRCGLD